MAYPYYQPYNNYLAYQQPVNAFQNGNSSQSQLQTQMVVRVPSFEAVKTFYAEPGKTVTFFNDNAPYCYVKSGGASPVDPPKIRIFELVERTGAETLKNGDLSDAKQENIDISLYAKKSEIEPFLCEIERISKEVEKLKEKDGANYE